MSDALSESQRYMNFLTVENRTADRHTDFIIAISIERTVHMNFGCDLAHRSHITMHVRFAVGSTCRLSSIPCARVVSVT